MTTQTSQGVRCGLCREPHPTAQDVRDCYARHYAEQADAKAEIEAEQAIERHLETNEEYRADVDEDEARALVPTTAPDPQKQYVPLPGHCPECGSNPGWSHDAGCSVAVRRGEEMVPAYDYAGLVTWLREQGWSEFAQSLVSFYDKRGYLTPKQVEAAEKLREQAWIDQRDNGPLPDLGAGWARLVPEGRYAIVEDGVVKFYIVRRPTEGKWAGATFLDAQASDELHPVKAHETKRRILTAIARDPREAALRYGHELGVCGRCGRTLTDEASRAAGIGPVCAKLSNW